MSTLNGLGIVLTRPAAQGQRLAERIRAAGGTPIVFPALEIADLQDASQALAKIDRLDEFDMAIFISQNAVDRGLALVRAKHRGRLPPAVAAVGAATARALREAGVDEVIEPRGGADSEALLAMPALHAMAGKRVVIFRGVGGRETLRDSLLARGAQVDYIECYTRARPRADAAPLIALWRAGKVQAVNIMSVQTLSNFVEMIGAQGLDLLRSTPIAVSHERVAAAARAQGCHDVRVTPAGDDGLLSALAGWVKGVTT